MHVVITKADPIQIIVKYCIYDGKSEEKMKMDGMSDAHVYTNIGGIDQPTYFSELTHCSLN